MLRALRDDEDTRAFVRLALPAVANSLLQTLVFLVDRLMLGHHSEAALAAMQTAGPVVWTTFSVFGAFAVGAVAVVGRAVGAGDARGASAAARGAFALALGIGLAVGVAGSALVEPILDALAPAGAAAVRAEARGFMRVTLPAMPLYFTGLAAVSVLQAAGDTRTPFAIGVATNAVNAIGNWFLIFGHAGAPRLGATGAAISSSAAALFEAALGVWALSRAASPVSLRARDAGGASALAGARRVVAVSWSAWGEKALYHAGYMLYVGFVVGLGATAMAANQALISIESVSWLTADGCATAAGALVAQRLGAGDPARARRIGARGAALCAGLLVLVAAVFACAPAPLVRAFRDDPAAVATGSAALRVAALAQAPMAVAIVLGQCVRAAGATREALGVTLAGALVVRLAATYLFVVVMKLGLAGVWLGSTADWTVRAALYAWRWRAGRWARATV